MKTSIERNHEKFEKLQAELTIKTDQANKNIETLLQIEEIQQDI
jgi:hypothetical protein